MKRSNSCLTLPILYEKSHYEDSNFFYFQKYLFQNLTSQLVINFHQVPENLLIGKFLNKIKSFFCSESAFLGIIP